MSPLDKTPVGRAAGLEEAFQRMLQPDETNQTNQEISRYEHLREELRQDDPDLTHDEVPNIEPKEDFLTGELEDEPFSFAAPQIESPDRRREMNYLE